MEEFRRLEREARNNGEDCGPTVHRGNDG
jgi:hypothetical protein